MTKLINDPSRYSDCNVITKVYVPSETVSKFRTFDTYTLHKLVYGMYAKIREDDDLCSRSGIYFSSKRDGVGGYDIIVSSNRQPIKSPMAGDVVYSGKAMKGRYVDGGEFKFSITVNAEKSQKASDEQRGKVVSLSSVPEIKTWFMQKAQKHGFEVRPESLKVHSVWSDVFRKGGNKVTLNKADISGTLTVTDQDLFREAVSTGIGRGKAFGCGLLMIEY